MQAMLSIVTIQNWTLRKDIPAHDLIIISDLNIFINVGHLMRLKKILVIFRLQGDFLFFAVCLSYL